MSRSSNEPTRVTRDRLADLLRRRGPIDLVRSALLVAAEEYPFLDIEASERRLEAMGRETARRTASLDNPFARLDALRVYLFEDLGFRGNTAQYDDPRNSFLNEVLDRRLGIPLTLSLVFMEVARQARFRVLGVGLPGHFVVRLEDGDRAIFVDPFHGGNVVTEEDCRDLVVRTTGRPSLFRREILGGTTDRATLARLLLNLKRIYLAREDYARALAAVDRLLLVHPDDAKEIRDRGFLLAHLGRPGAAVADLEQYLALAPGAPDSDSVRGRLAWLMRKMSGAT